MADIIATEQEAYEIGGKSTPVTNKICTKSRAIELGCNVESTYADNQLIRFKDLSRSEPDPFAYVTIRFADTYTYTFGSSGQSSQSYPDFTDNNGNLTWNDKTVFSDGALKLNTKSSIINFYFEIVTAQSYWCSEQFSKATAIAMELEAAKIDANSIHYILTDSVSNVKNYNFGADERTSKIKSNVPFVFRQSSLTKERCVIQEGEKVYTSTDEGLTTWFNELKANMTGSNKLNYKYLSFFHSAYGDQRNKEYYIRSFTIKWYK